VRRPARVHCDWGEVLEPVTAANSGEARACALDGYLALREADGYRVETRSGVQAVICRRHRFSFLLRWFAHDAGERRLVVSVDEHGDVTTVAAEPVRW
jgi:hypothetical protein